MFYPCENNLNFVVFLLFEKSIVLLILQSLKMLLKYELTNDSQILSEALGFTY